MNHQELIEKANIKLCPISARLILEENDVAASRGGKNTVYHHCDIYQGRPSYASCLMVMDIVAEGRAHLRPDCELAIAAGSCPALQMRKEELRAGRALFYVDYEQLTKERVAQLELDRLNSPIQFRRGRDAGKKFVPTTPTDKLAPTPNKQPAPTRPKAESAADDYNTNIMEQVVKKVLNENDENDR